MCADGGLGIGAGHLMRCLSIAHEVESTGSEAIFLVAGQESRDLVSRSGIECVQVTRTFSALGPADACEILDRAMPGDTVLVDSYAVTKGFFDSLADNELRTAYIDDRYLFALGALERPKLWNVDFVIDYGFGAESCGYGEVYADSETRLLLGSRFAPVRHGFREARSRRSRSTADRVLITCGSTNPERSLERMVEGCLAGCDLPIDVVVGGLADFDVKAFHSERINVHRAPHDLAPFMERAAFAISAAGTTLYELSCVGVPTVACQIVENQRANVDAFGGLGLGISLNLGWSADDVKDASASLSGDIETLECFHEMVLSAVDGRGSLRIAEALT